VLQKRGKPGQTSLPTGRELHHHATEIGAFLVARGNLGASDHFEPIYQHRVVEAFPNMLLAALVAEGKLPPLRRDASDRYREALVHDTRRLEDTVVFLLPGRALAADLRTCNNHEDRAALLCALTALAVSLNQYVGVGDPFDGDIILPPRALWGASVLGARHG
jgi:hypothetical protein